MEEECMNCIELSPPMLHSFTRDEVCRNDSTGPWHAILISFGKLLARGLRAGQQAC